VTEGAREPGRGIGRIGPRAAAWLAWSLCLLCVALLAVSVVLLLLNGPSAGGTGTWGTAHNTFFIFPVVILAFTLVGTLIASRHPDNPIGWVCLTIGLTLMLAGAAGEYDVYALQTRPGSLPGGEYMAWLETWGWVPPVVLIGTFLILLFPDGRLPSRRWRPVAWLCLAVLISASVSEAFFPGPLSEAPNVTNPFGIESARSALELVSMVSFLLLPLCFGASALSMILRFRRAAGEERQQLKWFASAAALLAGAFCTTVIASIIVEEVMGRSASSLAFKTAQDLVTLSFAGLPVAAGIAILRYRLYDIDVVINRTLVYATLTVMLAAVYLGGVVVLQYVFRALSGGESQLAIVTSTLAIAALFNPMRRRVQALVDRRFYRRKYDATKTLEAFNARLREETDLDALSNDLVEVARGTMQPAHVSLWLRPDTASKKDEAPG
jgi:hypothetical protein